MWEGGHVSEFGLTIQIDLASQRRHISLSGERMYGYMFRSGETHMVYVRSFPNKMKIICISHDHFALMVTVFINLALSNDDDMQVN